LGPDDDASAELPDSPAQAPRVSARRGLIPCWRPLRLAKGLLGRPYVPPNKTHGEGKGGQGVRKRLFVGLAATAAAAVAVVMATGIASAGSARSAGISPLPSSSCGPVVYKGTGSPEIG